MAFVKFLSALAFLTACVIAPVISEQPCSVAFKCSNEQQLAWATDGKNCMVFQNDCQLQSQNCQRANNYEMQLTALDKDECFRNCRVGCTRELNPVCTIRDGGSETFLNPCLWSEQMCKSGEAYVFQFRGRCEGPA